MADILQDDEEKDVVGGEGIENEDELESASAEPDFAPTASAPVFDDEDDAEADPHSSFDEHVAVEDPHQEDIYGDAGAPLGYTDDEEEEDNEEEYSDSDSY